MVFFVSLSIAALLAAAVIWFLQRYYAKATLDTALVRTGLGGRRVVLDGGCLSLPIVHQVRKVSMGTTAFSVSRTGADAALTRDQLRADIAFEIEFRVSPTEDAVAAAAQALGNRIARGGEAAVAVVSGTLVDAIQRAAASRALEDIHLDRGRVR